jgi:hypothetical protein
MKHLSIENARTIKPGDMVNVVLGDEAGCTALVFGILRETYNTFSPINGWYGGSALVLLTDFGPMHHYRLDPENPVAVAGYLTDAELADVASKKYAAAR